MISYSDLDESKKAFIFEFDNVLFPEKDYDLQVFYLFANFIEYLETFPPAQDLVEFMGKRYEMHGKSAIFEEIALTFGIDKKYEENLEKLYATAKLPLKLLLYKEALQLLQELVTNRKQIFILTQGEPAQQLNKLKQTEWHGLEKYLKIYFSDELGEAAVSELLAQNALTTAEVTFIGNSIKNEAYARKNQLAYLAINP